MIPIFVAATAPVAATAENPAPTLTAFDALTGATVAGVDISYEALLALSDASADTVGFRIMEVTTGTLTYNEDLEVEEGVTVIGTGDTLHWMPEVLGEEVGVLTAKAWDGASDSATAVALVADEVNVTLTQPDWYWTFDDTNAPLLYPSSPTDWLADANSFTYAGGLAGNALVASRDTPMVWNSAANGSIFSVGDPNYRTIALWEYVPDGAGYDGTVFCKHDAGYPNWKLNFVYNSGSPYFQWQIWDGDGLDHSIVSGTVSAGWNFVVLRCEPSVGWSINVSNASGSAISEPTDNASVPGGLDNGDSMVLGANEGNGIFFGGIHYENAALIESLMAWGVNINTFEEQGLFDNFKANVSPWTPA